MKMAKSNMLLSEERTLHGSLMVNKKMQNMIFFTKYTFTIFYKLDDIILRDDSVFN